MGTLQTPGSRPRRSPLATGQTHRGIFTSTLDSPLRPLLAGTTLAAGTEGRLPRAERSQTPALNHVLLHFQEDSIPFLLPPRWNSPSPPPRPGAPEGPASEKPPKTTPKRTDTQAPWTRTHRSTPATERPTRRGARSTATHRGGRPTSAEHSPGLPDKAGAPVPKCMPAHPSQMPGECTRISVGEKETRRSGRRALGDCDGRFLALHTEQNCARTDRSFPQAARREAGDA